MLVLILHVSKVHAQNSSSSASTIHESRTCKCTSWVSEKTDPIANIVGSWKGQGNYRKASISASLIMLKPFTVWVTTNQKILKEMGVPKHLTCFLGNLYVGQEAKVGTRYEKLTSLKLGKECFKAVRCHPSYLTSMQSTLSFPGSSEGKESACNARDLGLIPV